jgi:hypothetical protein
MAAGGGTVNGGDFTHPTLDKFKDQFEASRSFTLRTGKEAGYFGFKKKGTEEYFITSMIEGNETGISSEIKSKAYKDFIAEMTVKGIELELIFSYHTHPEKINDGAPISQNDLLSILREFETNAENSIYAGSDFFYMVDDITGFKARYVLTIANLNVVLAQTTLSTDFGNFHNSHISPTGNDNEFKTQESMLRALYKSFFTPEKGINIYYGEGSPKIINKL